MDFSALLAELMGQPAAVDIGAPPLSSMPGGLQAAQLPDFAQQGAAGQIGQALKGATGGRRFTAGLSAANAPHVAPPQRGRGMAFVDALLANMGRNRNFLGRLGGR